MPSIQWVIYQFYLHLIIHVVLDLSLGRVL